MPELPEVETVVRGLRPSLEGARIDAVTLARPDLRFPFPPNFAAVLNGTTVTALSRRAKYVLADLENGYVLVAHLGMSGSFRVEEPSHGSATPGEFHHPRSKDTSHDHVRMRLSNG
ncbi:MAG: DNA-formamidopyrimidine glycosylase family protein, partial [Pseudomonadota bacterium]